MDAPWFVYVLASTRTTRTYVGISTDAKRRLAQHNGERPGGARTTRADRPWRLVVEYGPFGGRGEALRAEHAVKRLRGRRRFEWKADPADGSPRRRGARGRSLARPAGGD